MAFIQNPQDQQTAEQAQQRQQQQLMAGGQPAFVGAQAATNTTAPQQQNQPKFTNIQSMLNANTGAGTQLANRIGSGINQELNQQGAAVSKAAGDVSSVANSIAQGKQALTNTLTSLGQTPDTSAPVPTAPVDTSTSTQTPAPQTASPTPDTSGGARAGLNMGRINVGNIMSGATPNNPALAPATPPPPSTATPQTYSKGVVDYGYLGSSQGNPDLSFLSGLTTGATQTQQQTNLNANTQALNAAAQSASNLASQRLGQLGTAAGRQALLTSALARGANQYGSGLSALDQSLMQVQAPSAVEAQKQAIAARQQGLAAQTQAAQQSATTAASDLASSQNLAKQTQTKLGDVLNQFQTGEQAKAQAIQTQNAADNAILAKFQSGGYDTLTSGEQARMQQIAQGSGAQIGERTYGLTPEQIAADVQMGSTNVGVGDVMTAADAAKYQVLKKLQGAAIGANDPYAQASGNTITNPGFSSQLQQDINAKQAAFQTAAQNTNIGNFNLAFDPNTGQLIGVQPYGSGGGSTGSITAPAAALNGTLLPISNALPNVSIQNPYDTGSSASRGWQQVSEDKNPTGMPAYGSFGTVSLADIMSGKANPLTQTNNWGGGNLTANMTDAQKQTLLQGLNSYLQTLAQQQENNLGYNTTLGGIAPTATPTGRKGQ